MDKYRGALGATSPTDHRTGWSYVQETHPETETSDNRTWAEAKGPVGVDQVASGRVSQKNAPLLFWKESSLSSTGRDDRVNRGLEARCGWSLKEAEESHSTHLHLPKCWDHRLVPPRPNITEGFTDMSVAPQNTNGPNGNPMPSFLRELLWRRLRYLRGAEPRRRVRAWTGRYNQELCTSPTHPPENSPEVT
uniref:Uncharacterized protein n=1 Tax=Pongo abelii TaxID=9601 RepID=A0A8I5TW39_PONAB